MQITFRATFDETSFPSDEPDSEYEKDGGWVDPSNPWGSFKQYRDDVSAEPDSVAFGNLADAVEFAAGFPGGIWDYSDSGSTMDSRTGIWGSRTLHVTVDPDSALGEFFNALAAYEKARDARLKLQQNKTGTW